MYMQRLLLLFTVVLILSGCSKATEAELQAKVNKCTAAGMNYTYLKDFRGKPYDVMCVSKRLR